VIIDAAASFHDRGHGITLDVGAMDQPAQPGTEDKNQHKKRSNAESPVAPAWAILGMPCLRHLAFEEPSKISHLAAGWLGAEPS